MSFADILNQAQKEVESRSGGGDDAPKTEYPKSKHDKLFFGKDNKEFYLQILPAADLVSSFAEPVRKIFLSVTTSKGKQLNQNFTLDPDFNPGSLLDNKIEEWAEKQMIPSTFGGQQKPRRVYLLNVIRAVQQGNSFVQERDAQGNIVVRVLELPQSGFGELIRKLQDPMVNPFGTGGDPLSFLHPQNPLLVRIQKPAKGQMTYPVDVFKDYKLPALQPGWENQLEDLKAHAVPTERLVNGLQWVQAFVDMKEGRNPNERKKAEAEQGQGQALGALPQQPPVQANPYAQQQQQQAYTAPQQPAQPNPYQTQQPAQNYAPPAPPVNTMPTQQQPAINLGGGLQADPMPDFGAPNVDAAMGNLPNAQPTQPTQPAYTPPAPPVQQAPQQPAPTQQAGVPDMAALDNMLNAALNE